MKARVRKGARDRMWKQTRKTELERQEVLRNRNWGWPTGTRVICSFHREYDFDNKTLFMVRGAECIIKSLQQHVPVFCQTEFLILLMLYVREYEKNHRQDYWVWSGEHKCRQCNDCRKIYDQMNQLISVRAVVNREKLKIPLLDCHIITEECSVQEPSLHQRCNFFRC